jgi:hypothetical protein
MIESPTRADVFDALDKERDFQDKIWDNHTEEGNNPSSWILWMEDYLNEARHLASRNSEAPGSDGRKRIMNVMRKVTAMGVACMEMNGVVHRDEPVKQELQHHPV